MAILVEKERRVVGVDRDQLGRCPGAALGQNKDLVEGAGRVDRPQHDRDEQDRTKKRQFMMKEYLQRARPVDASRLERILRHRFETREDD